MAEVDEVRCRLSTREETFMVDKEKRNRRSNSFQIKSEDDEILGSVNRRSRSTRYCLDDPKEARITLLHWVREQEELREEGSKERWWCPKYEGWGEYRPTYELCLVAKGILETYFLEREEGRSHGCLDDLSNYLLEFHVATYAGEEEWKKVSVSFINGSAESQTGSGDMFGKDLTDICNLLFVKLMPDPPVRTAAQSDLALSIEGLEKDIEGMEEEDLAVTQNRAIIREIEAQIAYLREEFRKKSCTMAHDFVELRHWLLCLRKKYESDPNPRSRESYYVQTLRRCAAHPLFWHHERRLHFYGKIKDAYKQSGQFTRTGMATALGQEGCFLESWFNDPTLPVGHPFREVYEDNNYPKTSMGFVFLSRDVVLHIHKKVDEAEKIAKTPPNAVRPHGRKRKRTGKMVGLKRKRMGKMVTRYFDERTQGDYNDFQFVEMELRRLYPGLFSHLYYVLCFDKSHNGEVWVRRC